MPYYEFKCGCGELIEELVKMGTDAIDCPKCGGKAPKIMSLCSFSLKGGGWYADGYGLKNSSSSPAISPKPETKTETKTQTAASTSDSVSKPDPS